MDILTVEEVAARLRVAKATIYRLYRQGQLKGFRVGDGGPIRILATSVDTLIHEQSNGQVATVKKKRNVVHPLFQNLRVILTPPG
jgi:excisionase family DNA binding protein